MKEVVKNDKRSACFPNTVCWYHKVRDVSRTCSESCEWDFTERRWRWGTQHRGPPHAVHPLCSEWVFFSQGWEAARWLTSRRIGFRYLCSHSKNHSRKYVVHFHDICFLLCRDIGLAAKLFLLNRSKCQVWFSQQAQLNGLPSTSPHK